MWAHPEIRVFVLSPRVVFTEATGRVMAGVAPTHVWQFVTSPPDSPGLPEPSAGESTEGDVLSRVVMCKEGGSAVMKASGLLQPVPGLLAGLAVPCIVPSRRAAAPGAAEPRLPRRKSKPFSAVSEQEPWAVPD